MKVQLLRPDDLLDLYIETVNLKLNKENPNNPILMQDDSSQPSFLIIKFPPQNIAEQAFYDNTNMGGYSQRPIPPNPDPPNGFPISPTPAGKVYALIGGSTRLAFLVPSNIKIPFTTEGLLDWSKLELHVSPIADVPPNGTPHTGLTISEPNADETVIELPYHIQLSPDHTAVWDHATHTVSPEGRTELWHTRLATRDSQGHIQPADNDHLIPLRAIWSQDYTPANPPHSSDGSFNIGSTKILSSLSRSDRYQIVILTSAFSGYFNEGQGNSTYVPMPINASRLMLSSLGGWLSSRGTWIPPHDLDISEWTHIASQGRDQYVRVVYKGKMKWTGHEASMVKVTERRFESDLSTGAPAAYLRQYSYIVIREPEIDYTNKKDSSPTKGRGMPFKSIRLTTLVTPHIDDPYTHIDNPFILQSSIQDTDGSFWVMVNGKDFSFHALAEDWSGNKIDFTTSLIFVPDSERHKDLVEKDFNNSTARRDVSVSGQTISFVSPSELSARSDVINDAGNGDNSSFITHTLNFVNESTPLDTTNLNTKFNTDPASFDSTHFFTPTLCRADVRIPSIQQIIGSDIPTSISITKQYLNNGFDNSNTTAIFSNIISNDMPSNGSGLNYANNFVDINFAAQQAGGLATPNMALKYISVNLGPLGGAKQAALDDLNNIMKNEFDPSKIFGDLSANLFGSFPLQKLLLPPVGSSKVDKDAPKMTVNRTGTTVIINLDWQPSIHKVDLSLVKFIPNIGDTPTPNDSKLVITGKFTKDLTGAANDQFLIKGTLNNFNIELLSVILVKFDLFTFTAQSGKKTDVNVKLQDVPVEFEGDLSFVNSLKDLIPSGSFGDGVSIDLIQNPLGVKASVDIALPPASVGIFSLRNIDFAADLTITFLEGKPTLDFSFARRDKHFLLTISFLGGGGFFHIGLDTSGIQILEAALEFGAAAALDLGVASGEVHLMAGIYFKMGSVTLPGTSTESTVAVLTGYIRCGGSLCILGLISVSVEFYLGLTYSSDTGSASGRATLTVTVEVAFFHKSVDLTVERSFGGSGGGGGVTPQHAFASIADFSNTVKDSEHSLSHGHSHPPTFAELMDAEAWEAYAQAFA